jgi:uncharacterized protein (TIGR02246 family)
MLIVLEDVMSRFRILVPALAVSLAAAACRPAPIDPNDPVITAAIDSIVQSTMTAAAHVDADGVLAMAEGGDLTFITGDVLLSGLDTIRARFKETYAGLSGQHQTLLEKRVRVLTPDVAIVMAIGEGTYTDKAGWTSPPVGIGTTVVFVREQGQWRARHAHQSIAF